MRLWRGLFGPCRVLTCLLQLTSLGCLSSSGPFLLAGESSDFTPRRFIVTTFEDSSKESSSVPMTTNKSLYKFGDLSIGAGHKYPGVPKHVIVAPGTP